MVPRRGLRSPAATYVVAVIGGGILFFLCFGAIFVGSWGLLALLLACYALAGSAGVRAGATPGPLALALVAAAAPWVLWLFPASIPEAGLGRALLWPATVVLMALLAWLGGTVMRRRTARRMRLR